ncbi:MAG: sigma-70 family RNA polymerase sigma factor [Patescibacteria group bacterium]
MEQFVKAYDEHSDAIFRHCFFRVRNDEIARDVMQEAYAKTWEYLARGNEVINIRAFLYKVANNLIIDGWKKKREESLDKMREESGFDPATAEHIATHHSAEMREVIEAINSIDKKYRDVVIMRYVDDMSPREIATILNESENAVSVRIHRGLQSVKHIFETDSLSKDFPSVKPKNFRRGDEKILKNI